MHIPILPTLVALFAPQEGGSSGGGSAADVVISGSGEGATCSISETQLADIRARAKKFLAQAINKGYQNFPIQRGSLITKTVNKFITEEAICATLTNEPDINQDNHNQLRGKYKGSSLNPKKAKENGVVAKRLGVKTSCMEGFDWAASPYYNEAQSCEDVLGAIDAKGLPAVMYAVDMPPKDIASEISKISIAPYYTSYTNGGPKVCGSGDHYVDAYHSITVSKAVPSIDYVMRGYDYQNWSAWTLLRSCTAESGATYTADDLMFNFGARVFIPVEVEENGTAADHTLIITSVAAASTSPLAGLVPDYIAFHRLIGGEFAKKVMLTAIKNGWDLEKN